MARVKAVKQEKKKKAAKAAAAVSGVPSGGDLLRATVVGVPAGEGQWLTLALVGGRWRVPGCAREVPSAAAREWAAGLPLAERRALAAQQQQQAAGDGGQQGGAWGEVYRAETRLAALRSAVSAAQAELGTLVLAATESDVGPMSPGSLEMLAKAYQQQQQQPDDAVVVDKQDEDDQPVVLLQQQQRVVEIDDRRE